MKDEENWNESQMINLKNFAVLYNVQITSFKCGGDQKYYSSEIEKHQNEIN